MKWKNRSQTMCYTIWVCYPVHTVQVCPQPVFPERERRELLTNQSRPKPR